MIKAEDIYKVTNNGLDIILHYYPQARDCVGTNRHFKRRPSEDDASACIKLFGKEGSQQVYKVTDFGDNGTAQRPVDICKMCIRDRLTTYRDQRGKPRKDFRDFMELRSKNEDFRNLMTLAMPAKFWYTSRVEARRMKNVNR